MVGGLHKGADRYLSKEKVPQGALVLESARFLAILPLVLLTNASEIFGRPLAESPAGLLKELHVHASVQGGAGRSGD